MRTEHSESSSIETPLELALDRANERLLGRFADRLPLPEQLLDVHDVARIYGVHPVTVRRFVRDGAIPRPRLVGGKLQRWRRCDLLSHIESLPRTSPHRGEKA